MSPTAVRIHTSAQFILTCASLLVLATMESNGHNREPWKREPAEIRRTLDSLVSVSVGPYVHFVVGSCFGGRCEQRVSIYRPGGEVPFIYRAADWLGPAANPRWYGVNRELPDEEAGVVLADARLAGVMSLIADTMAQNNRGARFWLRARFGRTAVHIDNASLVSLSYTRNVNGGQMNQYRAVEDALLSSLRARYQETQ